MGRKQTLRRLLQVKCSCRNAEQTDFYVNLGASASVEEMEERLNERLQKAGKTRKIKFVQLFYYPVDETEAEWNQIKNACVEPPEPEDTIERGEEDILIGFRDRRNHTCEAKICIITITVWDAIAEMAAEEAYLVLSNLRGVLEPFKRPGTDGPNCPCNEGGGEAYSIGCGKAQCEPNCSQHTRKLKKNKGFKYRLKGTETPEKRKRAEEGLKIVNQLSDLATEDVEDLCEDLFEEMTQFSVTAAKCRVGNEIPKRRPFSGATVISSRKVHPHTDDRNTGSGLSAMFVFCDEEDRQSCPQMHTLLNYSLRKEKTRGVAYKLPHRSLHMELGAIEPHASTRCPLNGMGKAKRIGVILHLHRFLNYPEHGWLLRKLRRKLKNLQERLKKWQSMQKEVPEKGGKVKMFFENAKRSLFRMQREAGERDKAEERRASVSTLNEEDDAEEAQVYVAEAEGEDAEAQEADPQLVAEHGQQGQGNAGRECPICKKAFDNEVKMNRHVERGKCRRGQNNAKAKQPHPKVVQNGAMKGKKRGSKEYTCQECGAKIRGLWYLKRHKKAVHEGIPQHLQSAVKRQFKCTRCNYETYQKKVLVRHMEACKAKKERERIRQRGLVCNKCGKRFTRYSNLDRHSRSVHEERVDKKCRRHKSKEKGSLKKKVSVGQEERSNEKEDRKCRYCEQVLGNTHNRVRHELLRCPLRPCGRGGVGDGRLRQLMQISQRGSKFECPIQGCTKQDTSLPRMRIHLEANHRAATKEPREDEVELQRNADGQAADEQVGDAADGGGADEQPQQQGDDPAGGAVPNPVEEGHEQVPNPAEEGGADEHPQEQLVHVEPEQEVVVLEAADDAGEDDPAEEMDPEDDPEIVILSLNIQGPEIHEQEEDEDLVMDSDP